MENNKNDEKKESSAFEIFGLGGLFKGLEKLVDLATKLEDNGKVSGESKFDLDHIKKGMKGVYGFTINTAAGGKPTVETFGNIKKTAQGPKVNEEREPITDLFNETDEIIIIAEMPGIEESDLTIQLNDDILEIAAVSKSRTYRKEIFLPQKLDSQNITHKYTNGILEIKIKK
jgi:HSP20 family protein